MECGVPFCHSGCPLGNLIPDWNDLVYRDRWAEASEQLHRTNNFPEFTGRLCPAPCEAACVLEINEGDAVSIKQIELAIVNRAWDEGWIVPQPPAASTGRSVAVVGSGPAGLACAQQLARAGEQVTVYERDEAAGGLIRFGVPEFKIEKRLVERRVEQLVAEGVEFRLRRRRRRSTSTSRSCARGHDAVVLAVGSRVPRDLPVPGRELDGVHFAMEYLYERARAIDGTAAATISAAGKHVVVIGGGDTGADCVGHAHREGAASVMQIELLGEPPPARRDDLTPWPTLADEAPYLLRAEGGRRPRLLDLDDPFRRRRVGGADRLAAEHWRPAVRARRGDGGGAARRARAARDGLPRPRTGAPRRARRSSATRAATSPRLGSPPRSPACSPPATRGAGSR